MRRLASGNWSSVQDAIALWLQPTSTFCRANLATPHIGTVQGSLQAIPALSQAGLSMRYRGVLPNGTVATVTGYNFRCQVLGGGD